MDKFKGVKLDWRIGMKEAISTGLIIGIGAGLLSYVDYRKGCLLTAIDFMGNFGEVIMGEVEKTK